VTPSIGFLSNLIQSIPKSWYWCKSSCCSCSTKSFRCLNYGRTVERMGSLIRNQERMDCWIPCLNRFIFWYI